MVAELRDFTVVTKLIKILRVYMVLGDDVSTLRDVCMDFEPCFKLYNLVSIRPKSMKLGQMTKLIVIFIWWGQFIDWLQFKTRPSSPLNFGMAYDSLKLRQTGNLIARVFHLPSLPESAGK